MGAAWAAGKGGVAELLIRLLSACKRAISRSSSANFPVCNLSTSPCLPARALATPASSFSATAVLSSSCLT